MIIKKILQSLSIFLFGLFLSVSICFGMSPAEKVLKKKLAKVPRVDCKTALRLHKSGKLILLDVHEHLKVGDKSPIFGAIVLPFTKIEKYKLKWPKNKLIGCF